MKSPVARYHIQIRLIVAALLLSTSLVAGQEPLTTEQWREDLRYMAEQMPQRHKNLYHTMTEEEFYEAVAELDAQIPGLERHEIIVGLARIVAMVRDGHSGIKGFVPDQGVGFRTYPIIMYMYDDGLFVQRAHRDYADMVGGRVVQIGNFSSTEAVEIVSDLVFRDNTMFIKYRTPHYLASPELLHAVGIIEDMEAATYVVERDGQRQTFTLSPLSSTRPSLFGGFFEDLPDWVDDRDEAPSVPMWIKNSRKNYWFEYIEDKKTVYVQYNECVDSADESIDDFFERVFVFVDSAEVERFILDLRLNGGGETIHNTPIVVNVIKSRINEPGKFFVILGRRTVSAAQNLVNHLEEFTDVTFVGEPTAQHVQFYSDAATIVLPNSELRVRVSAIWFQLLSPNDTRAWTAPDIAAELTSQDYQTGRDPALEAILSYSPRPGLEELLVDALASNDVEATREVYVSYKSDPANAYKGTEAIMNRLGYGLMGDERVELAIEVFRLNVESYPRSANARDSLGEAYLKNGDIELATHNYQRAVALDPDGPIGGNARKVLETIASSGSPTD